MRFGSWSAGFLKVGFDFYHAFEKPGFDFYRVRSRVVRFGSWSAGFLKVGFDFYRIRHKVCAVCVLLCVFLESRI